MPIILLGDLNVDTNEIPAISRLIDELGWVDAGGKAQIWGGEPNQPTCKAPNANKANRRDYSFISPELGSRIASFSVQYSDAYPFHQPLDLVLKCECTDPPKEVFLKTASFAQAYQDSVANIIDIARQEIEQVSRTDGGHGSVSDGVTYRVDGRAEKS